MNKLTEGNQTLLSDVDVFVDQNGRIGQLKDGDASENICDEDETRSLTLESLKDKPKWTFESQRDRDFVSESSLTIVSDSDLFQENSRWWSMINNSESNSNSNSNSNVNITKQNFDSSTYAVIPHLNNSINDINNNITGNTSSIYNKNSAITPPPHISNTATNNNKNHNMNHNNNINNNGNGSSNNFFHGTRNSYQIRRRSSLLSDITIESDDNDDDEQTTTSGDSSWANNSALLTTARRFAPNYCPSGNNRVNNEFIEEELYDCHEKLKRCRDSAATNAAPVIPRRRISKHYKGPNRSSANINSSMKAATATAAAGAGEFYFSPSKISRNNPAYRLHVMARGNAAAPTIPKRTSSHNSKKPSIKHTPILYQIYNASITSIVSSQISHDIEPSFFEDGSVAAEAAAAYLSTHSREESPIDTEIPPMLPERQDSVNKLPPMTFGTFPSFDDDNDEHPYVVHEEGPLDSDSVASNPKMSSHQLPSIPMRKHSGSDKSSSHLSRTLTNMKPASRLNTQPPTLPMRKVFNHHAQKSPIPMHVPVIQLNRSKAFNQLWLSPHKSQGHQLSQKHKPPTKPTRTNSNSNNRSSEWAATSSS